MTGEAQANTLEPISPTPQHRLIHYWKARCQLFPTDLGAHRELFDAFKTAEAYDEGIEYWKERVDDRNCTKDMRITFVEAAMRMLEAKQDFDGAVQYWKFWNDRDIDFDSDFESATWRTLTDMMEAGKIPRLATIDRCRSRLERAPGSSSAAQILKTNFLDDYDPKERFLFWEGLVHRNPSSTTAIDELAEAVNARLDGVAGTEFWKSMLSKFPNSWPIGKRGLRNMFLKKPPATFGGS